MKIHAIISFLCLASVALGTSCKDDETHFLQRSHDALSFPYLNSTKELLVLTNGSWKITPDDTWISCSPGEGNGAPKEQAVNITVAQNAVNGQIPTTWDFRPTKSDRNRTYWINCSYSSISSLLRLEKLLAERQK